MPLAQFYCQEGGPGNNGGGPSSMSGYVKSRPAKATHVIAAVPLEPAPRSVRVNPVFATPN